MEGVKAHADLVLAFPHLPFSSPLPQEKLEQQGKIDSETHLNVQAKADQKDCRNEAGTELPKMTFDKPLVREAQLLLQLLYEVDAATELALYSEEGMRVAMHRYERFWLPLLVKYRKKRDMGPPLDVAWAWLMHTLAPSKYAEDFRSITGVAANFILADSPQHRDEKAIATGKRLWEYEFPEERYKPPGIGSGARMATGFGWVDDGTGRGIWTRITYDLIAAAARQQVFLYQVGLPHWRYDWFVRQCFERYQKFLLLRKKNPSNFLVPTFDIDLMWHAHMANHASYEDDLKKITGTFLDHDDSINDRTTDGQLDNGYKGTCKLWQETYNQEYVFEGAMYRGKLPGDTLFDLQRVNEQLAVKLCVPWAKRQATKKDGVFKRILVAGPSGEIDGSRLSEYRIYVSSPSSRWYCGKVITRAPLGLKAPPACVVVFDAQDCIAAVSRPVGRDQLPLRIADSGNSPTPFFETHPSASPSFLVQACDSSGGSDWAVVQCSLDLAGQLQGSVFRLGTEFFETTRVPFWEQMYVGKLRTAVTTAELRTGGQTTDITLAFSSQLTASRRKSQDEGSCTCFSFLRKKLPDGFVASMQFPACGAATMKINQTENEFCLAALTGTLSLLFGALTGQELMPNPAAGASA